jgi:hypothetical protein
LEILKEGDDRADKFVRVFAKEKKGSVTHVANKACPMIFLSLTNIDNLFWSVKHTRLPSFKFKIPDPGFTTCWSKLFSHITFEILLLINHVQFETKNRHPQS